MEDDFEKIIPGASKVVPVAFYDYHSSHYIAGNYTYPQQSSQDNKFHGEANFVDGSGPLFTMYLELAEEEDKKRAESWKADADEILVFVSPICLYPVLIDFTYCTIDWLILCCRCRVDCSIYSRSAAKLARQILHLSCKYLSTPCQFYHPSPFPTI